MSTAYTSGVADGKVTDFGTFVRQCAHGFLVHLREESMDGPLRKLEPSSYNKNGLRKAKQKLAKAKSMTLAEAARDMAKKLREAKMTAVRLDEGVVVQRKRYKAMLAEVKAWLPPSPRHAKLKEFMVAQLEQSIEFDCPEHRKNGESFRLEAWGDTPEAYRLCLVKAAERDVAYHEDELAKEQKCIRDTNEWIDQLEGSLK